MDKRVKYWIDLSDYDLETAAAMLYSGRYLYVGFMYHQTIEKIIKAYFNARLTKQYLIRTCCHIWLRKQTFRTCLKINVICLFISLLNMN